MAKRPLEFHPDARIDALEAFDWYAEHSGDAADAFQEELQDAGNSIRHAPERWANYLFGTRRYLMRRFLVRSLSELLARKVIHRHFHLPRAIWGRAGLA